MQQLVCAYTWVVPLTRERPVLYQEQYFMVLSAAWQTQASFQRVVEVMAMSVSNERSLVSIHSADYDSVASCEFPKPRAISAATRALTRCRAGSTVAVAQIPRRGARARFCALFAMCAGQR